MSTTAEDRLRLAPASDTRDEGLRPAYVRFVGSEARLKASVIAADDFLVDAAAQTPSKPDHVDALSFAAGPEGILVEDVLGAVYGVGLSPEAAVADYFIALDDRLRVLRERRTSLHPRLVLQLRQLETLFPGR